MQLGRIWVREFKGVSVTLDPASANVFFGPNDAGKSNILEAISTAFGGRASWRSDPLRDDDLGGAMGCDFMIRLDDAALSTLLAQRGSRAATGRPVMLLNEPGGMLGRIELDYQALEGVLNQLREKLVAMIEEYLSRGQPPRRSGRRGAAGQRHRPDHPGRPPAPHPPSPPRQDQGVRSAIPAQREAEEDHARCRLAAGAISGHGW